MFVPKSDTYNVPGKTNIFQLDFFLRPKKCIGLQSTETLVVKEVEM